MILEISNDSGPQQTVADSIYNLLKSVAERNASAIAIAAPDRQPLAYRRLLRQVEDTVRALASAGLSRNDRVALVLPNGPEMAVAFLAVASGQHAPLNPAYTGEFDYRRDLNARALIVASGMNSPARKVAQSARHPF
jgi:acyl-CoA synthetase (AMP-forming)/AMP-acid ligase II